MIYTWKSHRLYSLTDELKGVSAAILDKIDLCTTL